MSYSKEFIITTGKEFLPRKGSWCTHKSRDLFILLIRDWAVNQYPTS